MSCPQIPRVVIDQNHHISPVNSCLLLFYFVAVAGVLPTLAAEDELAVVRIQPYGQEVAPNTQILIEFNLPMVPLGDMSRKVSGVPVEISPALECDWQWLNRQALSCLFNDGNALKLATKYQLTILPEFKSSDGLKLRERRRHEFSTRLPKIRYSQFQEWLGPTRPTLNIRFDQPVPKESLETRIALVDPETRSQTPTPVRLKPVLLNNTRIYEENKDGEWQALEIRERDPQYIESLELPENFATEYWHVIPTVDLLPDTTFDMRILAGLASIHGPERTKEDITVTQVVTFPDFQFVGIRCENAERKRVEFTIDAADLDSPENKCNPRRRVGLLFSAPVEHTEIAEKVRFMPSLSGNRKDYDPWKWVGHRWYSNHRQTPRNYIVRLPEYLQADQRYVIEQTDSGLVERLKHFFDLTPRSPIVDVFGRPLTNSVEMEFWTRHRDSQARMAHADSVLESAVESQIPIYVTNLKALAIRYFATTSEETQSSQVQRRERPLPDVVDVAYAVPLGVRELLGVKSGAVYGEIRGLDRFETPSSQPIHSKRFFSQVTPYNIHLKVGHFNSIAWITDMATGEPVSDTQVTVYRNLQDAFNQNSQVKTSRSDTEGIAPLPGSIDLFPDSRNRRNYGCQNNNLPIDFADCERVVLRVDGPKGLGILPLTYRYDLQTWPSRLPRTTYPRNLSPNGHTRVWGTTAQGVYRKGETIQYKIYVRSQDMSGLVPTTASGYRIKVVDPAGKTIHVLEDITLNEFGAFHGSVKIPDNALMGWYRFVVFLPDKKSKEAFRTLVTDFTPAAVRVENRLNGEEFQRGDQLTTTTNATLFSGGPYRNAETQVSVTLSRRSFITRDPRLDKFDFSTFQESRRSYQTLVARVRGELSATGEHELTTELDVRDYPYGTLKVESVVRDDRGRSVATESHARYFGVDRFVGMKRQHRSYHESEEAKIDVVVVDRKGKSVADTKVDIKLQQNRRIAARVKSSGNAYTTRFTSTWDTIDVCSGFASTDSMQCSFQLPAAGTYRAIASIEDTRGVTHATKQQFYVRGSQYVVWANKPDYQLKLIPQNKDIQVGETARYLIENPFPQAKALVTVERYGILDQWMTTLESSTPILEVPIKPDYVPGVYISVLVVSPRVADPPVTETETRTELDLGKPSFRMGYAKLSIADPYKQLIVEAHLNQDVFKPGDVVKVALSAKPRTPTDEPEPVEFAVAVLDESVLDLIDGGTMKFDPYQGFYRLGALDMANYSLLHRLVGVQEFAKKGASPGGDGGGSLKLRSIEKFVGYWNPSLKADTNGRAAFEFTLPDNLTGWRILAVAVTPSDRFGLGEGSFKSNQPTELRSALPNQVTESDKFFAEFTVLNRTDQARTLRVQIDAIGDVDGMFEPLDTTLKLGAQQRTNVGLPIRVAYVTDTRETTEGRIRFEVRVWDDIDGDALRIDLPVLKRRTLHVATHFGRLDDELTSEAIQIPSGIYEDVGDIEVNLNASLVGELSGSIDYLLRYPYKCWEQQISRAVGYAQQLALKQYLPPKESSASISNTIAGLLDTAINFQASNGGMTYWLPRVEYASPYLSAYTALAFQWLRENGHDVDVRVETDLHQYLQGLLRNEGTKAQYTDRMLATVRAVALHALVRANKADVSMLRRYESHTSYMSVFGLAHFLAAAQRLPGTDELVAELVRQMLMSSNRTSGRLLFSEEADSSFRYIHESHQRTNCASLSAFAGLFDDEGSYVLESDVTGLVRELTHTRGERDRWNTTQDNAFCLVAFADYANKLETVVPNMDVAVELKIPPAENALNLGGATWKGFNGSHFTSVTPIRTGYSGQAGTIDIRRRGVGRLYYQTKLTYASKAEPVERVNVGIAVRREYSIWQNNTWRVLKSSDKIHKSDLLRIDLFVSTPANRHFVVVADAVPAGLEPLNFDLANTANVDKVNLYSDESYWHTAKDWISYGRRWYGRSFYFKEIGHRSVRFHAEFLRAGRHHVVWFGQVVSKGEFSVAPTDVEEMYSPDVYAKSLPFQLKVE